MPVCPKCTQLVEDGLLLCPHCRAPLQPTTPLSRRATTVVALVIVVAALAMLVRWLIVRGTHA